MDKFICVSTGIVTFILLAYICLGVDYISSYLTDDVIDHPIMRLLVLGLMALAFCFDPYVAILIGFAYLLTKFTLKFDEPMNVQQPIIFNVTKEKDASGNETIELDEDEGEFTTEEQFNSAQSNIYDEEAYNTEVKTWEDEMGPQSNLVKN
jgi:hypothetical protein